MNKIDKIHCVLNKRQATIGSSPTVSNVCTSAFREFIEVSQDDVKEYVSKPSRKSCDLDPLPARVFKICSNLLLPTITKIVNLSLSVGMIPDIFKVAELLPLLEKQTLIINYFQTFSPFLI